MGSYTTPWCHIVNFPVFYRVLQANIFFDGCNAIWEEFAFFSYQTCKNISRVFENMLLFLRRVLSSMWYWRQYWVGIWMFKLLPLVKFIWIFSHSLQRWKYRQQKGYNQLWKLKTQLVIQPILQRTLSSHQQLSYLCFWTSRRRSLMEMNTQRRARKIA